MGVTCATGCSHTRCAKRTATSCTTNASLRTRCGSASIRGASTSTSIPRRPKCAFVTPARSTSSSATRSSARWPRRRRSSRRCRRRSASASPLRICRRACRRTRVDSAGPDGRQARRRSDGSAVDPRAYPAQRGIRARYRRTRGILSAAVRRAQPPSLRRCRRTTRIRSGSRSRSCTASTSSRKTAPA